MSILAHITGWFTRCAAWESGENIWVFGHGCDAQIFEVLPTGELRRL